jgi:two-component system cell cycle response regulator
MILISPFAASNLSDTMAVMEMKIDYKDLVDNMCDGLYLVDRDIKISFWNNAAERITGFMAQEVIGSHCFDNILIHVDDKGHKLCQGGCPLATTMEDGGPREAEVYLHHKDGHRVPVSVRSTPWRNATGEVIGGIEIFTDLSPRERPCARGSTNSRNLRSWTT